MRLSDIMSQMGLAGYAELGLVLFFFVFILVTLRALFFTRNAEYQRAADVPFDDESLAAQSQGEEL
jgi:cbb3-type cytochrome oxidase subunit 3